MKFTSVQLLSTSLRAQAKFYGETLGLPVLEDTASSVVVKAGATQLVFSAAPTGWAGAYHFAFNIPENQLASAKAWLTARTPLVRGSTGEDEFDFANWNAHAVYFYDAAGNIVELIARHALDNATDGAFDGSRLLCVSEVGLASPDVRATVGQLQAEMGVAIFRGSDSENFAAVGDEDGLFIVVREGRLWYPDSRVPAQPLAPRGHRFRAGRCGAQGVFLDRPTLPYCKAGYTQSHRRLNSIWERYH